MSLPFKKHKVLCNEQCNNTKQQEKTNCCNIIHTRKNENGEIYMGVYIIYVYSGKPTSSINYSLQYTHTWPTRTKGWQSRWEDHEITGENITYGSFYQFIVFDFFFFHIVGRLVYQIRTAHSPFQSIHMTLAFKLHFSKWPLYYHLTLKGAITSFGRNPQFWNWCQTIAPLLHVHNNSKFSNRHIATLLSQLQM